ncbi:MAG: hypothetical protein GWO83_00555 [Bacteroidia bacterium]|nr:hypothetical protein [Bacteroidia bacterium]
MDRFHGLRAQIRQLQQEASNSRFALLDLSNRQTASRSILPTPPYTGAITGTITEEGTGTPLSGVWVDIYDSGGNWTSWGSTNTSGVYTSSSGLATGDYFLRTYDYTGHINELYDDILCLGWCTMTSGTPVSVTDAATTSGIDFALTPGGRISGTVTKEGTSNPISGLYVEIYDSGGKYVTDGTSDGSGNYITDAGLTTGTYYARTYSSDGYIDELYDDIQCVGTCTVTDGTPISVTIGIETPGIDFALAPGGLISGTVEDASSHLPIASMWVSIFDTGGTYLTYGYTDGAGSYTSYSALPTGTYYALTSNSSGYLNELYDDILCASSCTVTDGTPINVTAGATTPGIDFDLLVGGAIEGTVTEDGSGTPLESGYVRIYDASGNSITTAYPNSSGDYRTSLGLVSGTYYALTRSFEGYLDELYDDILCDSGCTPTDGTPISVTVGATTSDIDFALVEGGYISGTVTEDGSGDGLDTGNVTIYDASGDWVVDAYPSATGTYVTYKALTAGTYYARTWNFDSYFNELYDDISCVDGCTVTGGTPIIVTAGATTSGIDFALAKGGSIQGTVTEDGTAALLEDVNIDIYDDSGSWVASGTTDTNGGYTTSQGLTTGTYYARTWNSDLYINELYDDIPCVSGCTVTDGTLIAVTAGSTTTGIDFALTPGGRISGTVTDDDTAALLEGISVNIFDDSGDYVTGTNSDASGAYENFTGLPAGTYFLKTWNDDGYVDELYDDMLCVGGCTVTSGTPVVVTTGGTTTGIDFALTEGGSIAGTVTVDGSGTPLDTGYVRIYDSAGNSLTTSTPDASGSYETTTGMPSGTYYARARSFEGYLEELYDDLPCAFGCTPSDGTPIAVTAGDTTANIDFGLAAEATITGTVTDDTTHLGLDTGYLYFYDVSGDSLTSVYPDANGDYSFSGLPAGTFYARTYSFEGYWDELYDDIDCSNGCTVTDGTPIVATAGGTTTGIDFALTRGGMITGTVTESSGHTGLDTGKVNIYNDTGNWVTRGYPDASGVYISQLPLEAGTYYARTYSFEGYQDELYDNIPCVGGCTVTSGTPIVVTAATTTSGVDFELDAGGLISGTVTDDSTHVPLDTGYIDFYNASGNWVANGWPDASGNYISNNALPAGSYYARTGSFEGYFDELYDDIDCSSGCTVTDGTPILVTAGSTTSGIDFELTAGGLISGTVTDGRTGLPLDSGRVNIYNDTGGYVTRGYPDSSGQYTVQKALETGTYYARTWYFDDYFDELYSEISCALSCTVTDGTPIAVTLGSTTTGVDFALGESVFADGFESGDLSDWSGAVQ